MDDLIWTGSLNDPYAIRGSVGLYDTTLRDGEQTVGVVLNPDEKLEIAKLLDELGVDRIEAGFPRVSDDDWQAVAKIAPRPKAEVVFACRSRRPGGVGGLGVSNRSNRRLGRKRYDRCVARNDAGAIAKACVRRGMTSMPRFDVDSTRQPSFF